MVPTGHHDQRVLAAAPGAVAAAARLAVLGAESALDAEVHQRVDAFARAERDAAAMPAIAAVGPAERHELLAPEADAAATAVAGLNFDACFVDEFHDCVPATKNPACGAGFLETSVRMRGQSRFA